jgi:hypothetical protein
MVKEEEIKKLVLIKALFLRGCTLSTKKDVISRMLTIHHFDFVVETTLKLLAFKYNINITRKEPSFPELLDEIIKNTKTISHFKNELSNLHQERNLV